jgi:putative permease
MGEAISRLIRGQIEICTLLAIYYGLSFHLIGQLAAQNWSLFSPWLLLGMVTGYLNLLPYIGVPLGGILVCFLGLMTYQLDVLWIYPAIIAVITLGTTVDHKLLTPSIIGRSVKVHEIFVYFAIYFGGALGGIVGILLALPAMAVVSVFVRYFYQHWLVHRQDERQQFSTLIDFSAKG